MFYSIQHPGLLTIPPPNGGTPAFGPDQGWFENTWRADSGCGPVSASLIMAYLAFTQPHLRPLYIPESLTRPDWLIHMNTLFEFVTPGRMGVNKLPIYTDGVLSYAASRGVSLIPQAFDVPGVLLGKRKPSQELADFVAAGLASDTPIGLLVLSRGKESRLQHWHWITITSAEINGTDIQAHASDEGAEISFDLQLWYTTTHLSGGLAYFAVSDQN